MKIEITKSRVLAIIFLILIVSSCAPQGKNWPLEIAELEIVDSASSKTTKITKNEICDVTFPDETILSIDICRLKDESIKEIALYAEPVIYIHIKDSTTRTAKLREPMQAKWPDADYCYLVLSGKRLNLSNKMLVLDLRPKMADTTLLLRLLKK